MTTSHDPHEAGTDVDALLKQWQEASATAGDDAFWGPEPRSRWRPQTLIIAGVLGAVLVAATIAGTLRSGTGDLQTGDSTSTQPRSSSPAPSAGQATPVNWVAVLRSVDRAREMAWEDHDAALLRAVFAANGPALRRETDVVEQMRANGVQIRGWRATVLGVAERTEDDSGRILLVTDRRSSYQWRHEGGPWRFVPAAGTRRWRVTMRPLADVWLVWDVRPARA